jgi:hypothetical protein
MLKFAAFAALATASVLAAAPASAADTGVRMVRVSVAGKSPAQIEADIQSAARNVCEGESPDCVDVAVRSAHRQLLALTARQQAPASMHVDMLSSGVYAVRVSLTGKSAEQVQSDIQSAAVAVCKPANLARLDYAQCVSTATRTAKEQLRNRKLASN